MLVVGAKEAESGQVSYRDRLDGDRGAMPLADAIHRLDAESKQRTIGHVTAPAAAPQASSEGPERHAY